MEDLVNICRFLGLCVIIPRRPSRVHLHVKLPLFSSLEKKFWKINFLIHLFLKFHFIDFQLLQFLNNLFPSVICLVSGQFDSHHEENTPTIQLSGLLGELLKLFSLVQVQNQSFGPKQNAKLTVDPPTHLPKTFWRVLGIVGG